MRLLIDGRALVGNRTGIGVHTAEITRRLGADTLIASHAPIDDREGLEHCRFRVDRAPLGVVWQQLILPRIGADVLWGPHGTLPLATRVPSVVTLHDFTSITMPHKHRLQTVLSFNLFIGRSLELARKVACVSRAVADEAMRGFGVPASKMEIVPNGVDEYFTPGGEDGGYVLYAGTLEPRKGIGDLVAVWRSLPEPRPRLVLCGGHGWKFELPRDVEVTGYVPRAKLRELYRGARAFVYPSHHEGFGIPPLEAMACGAPVIATRTGAIAEFAEGAAMLFDPGDLDALRTSLTRVLRDGALRAELRAKGAARAREWTWERGARVMRELIAEAARCA